MTDKQIAVKSASHWKKVKPVTAVVKEIKTVTTYIFYSDNLVTATSSKLKIDKILVTFCDDEQTLFKVCNNR